MNSLSCLRSRVKTSPNKDLSNPKPEGKDSLFQSSADQQDKLKMVENHTQSKAEMSVRQSQPLNNKKTQDLQNEALNHLMLDIIAPHNKNANLESMVEKILVVIDMFAEQGNSNVKKDYDSQFAIKDQFPRYWSEGVLANKQLYDSLIEGAYVRLNEFAVSIKPAVSQLRDEKVLSSSGAKAIQGMLLLLKKSKDIILHPGYTSENRENWLTVVYKSIKQCEDLLRDGEVKPKWIENVKLTLNDSTYILKLARDNGSLGKDNYINLPESAIGPRYEITRAAAKKTEFEVVKKELKLHNGGDKNLVVEELAKRRVYEDNSSNDEINFSGVGLTTMPSQNMCNIYHPSRYSVFDVSRNKIEQLESDIFQENSSFNKSTYSIDLSGNNIKKIPNGVFNRAKRLEHIRLHGNPIEEVEEGAFGNVFSVIYLPNCIDDSKLISGLGEKLRNLREHPELKKFITIERGPYSYYDSSKDAISIHVDKVGLSEVFIKSDENAKYYSGLATYCCSIALDSDLKEVILSKSYLKWLGERLGLTDNKVETLLKEKLKEAGFNVQ